MLGVVWVIFGCGRVCTEPPGPRLEATLDLSESTDVSDGSYAQATLVRSTARQHPELVVRVLDVSALSTSERADQRERWGLGGVDVQVGPVGPRVPVVRLVDQRGCSVDAGKGFVAAASLEASVQALLGQPGGPR